MNVGKMGYRLQYDTARTVLLRCIPALSTKIGAYILVVNIILEMVSFSISPFRNHMYCRLCRQIMINQKTTYLIPLRACLNDFVWLLPQFHNFSFLEPCVPRPARVYALPRIHRFVADETKYRRVRRVQSFVLQQMSLQSV